MDGRESGSIPALVLMGGKAFLFNLPDDAKIGILILESTYE